MLDKAKTTIARSERLTSIEFVPISRLEFGDKCPAGPLHVRKTASTAEEDAATKASIAAEGILQSVLACDVDNSGTLYLAIGNRRLRLAREIAKETKIPADGYMVPAIILKGVTPAEARAMSLAENIERVPLHPVDRYEAFKQLVDDGLTIDQVAHRHGMTRKPVEQSMALGALSDNVRAAWRAATIREDVARVFTLAADHKRQDQVLARVTKGLPRGGQPQAWQVRQELKIDSNGYLINVLKLVGREAYEKAGGKLTTDLFTDRKSDEQIIANPDILERLVEEKMQAECTRLVDSEGWKWAEIDRSNNRYMADQLEKKKYTEEEKKGRGCYVFLDHGPSIRIERGFTKSRARVAAEKAQETKAEKAKAKPANKNAISNALERSLRAQFCTAVKSALTAHPHKDALGELLAALTAKMIHTTSELYSSQTPGDIGAAMTKIADTIAPKVMNEALRAKFDAKNYFERINSHMCQTAITAMGAKTKSTKKSDLVKLAIATQKTCGWLPRELRTSHYNGPSKKK